MEFFFKKTKKKKIRNDLNKPRKFCASLPLLLLREAALPEYTAQYVTNSHA